MICFKQPKNVPHKSCFFNHVCTVDFSHPSNRSIAKGHFLNRRGFHWHFLNHLMHLPIETGQNWIGPIILGTVIIFIQRLGWLAKWPFPVQIQGVIHIGAHWQSEFRFIMEDKLINPNSGGLNTHYKDVFQVGDTVDGRNPAFTSWGW